MYYNKIDIDTLKIVVNSINRIVMCVYVYVCVTNTTKLQKG